MVSVIGAREKGTLANQTSFLSSTMRPIASVANAEKRETMIDFKTELQQTTRAVNEQKVFKQQERSRYIKQLISDEHWPDVRRQCKSAALSGYYGVTVSIPGTGYTTSEHVAITAAIAIMAQDMGLRCTHLGAGKLAIDWSDKS